MVIGLCCMPSKSPTVMFWRYRGLTLLGRCIPGRNLRNRSAGLSPNSACDYVIG